MRTLILLTLLLPLAASAQRFDITARCGYSITDDLPETNNTKQIHGPSNQVSIGYYGSQHFLLSAFYEWNTWKSNAVDYYYSPVRGAAVGSNHSFGISPTYTSRYFVAGINLQMTKLDNISNANALYSFRYKPTFCGGIHMGSKQRIYKQLYVSESIGLSTIIAKGTVEYYTMNHGVKSSYPGYADISSKFLVYNFRAGLSYELSFNKKENPKTKDPESE